MSDQEVKFDSFGMPTVAPEERDWLQDPAPEEEAVAPDAQTEEPAAETTETQVSDQPTDQEELIFGKYKSLDEAEKGMKNLQDLQRRTAVKAREHESELSVAQDYARQLEATLQQVVPYINQLERGATGTPGEAPAGATKLYDEMGNEVAVPQGLSPQQVEALVAQRVSAARMEDQTSREAQENVAGVNRALEAFTEAHPEFEFYGEADDAMYNTVQTLNQAWERFDSSVDIGDVEALEAIYEASQNPELLKVLQLNPALFDNDEGMQLARFQASVLKGTPITELTRTVPASQVGQRAATPPVTESAAGGGAPPGSSAPLNEWQQAVLAYRSDAKKNTGSPFFE